MSNLEKLRDYWLNIYDSSLPEVDMHSYEMFCTLNEACDELEKARELLKRCEARICIRAELPGLSAEIRALIGDKL